MLSWLFDGGKKEKFGELEMKNDQKDAGGPRFPAIHRFDRPKAPSPPALEKGKEKGGTPPHEDRHLGIPRFRGSSKALPLLKLLTHGLYPNIPSPMDRIQNNTQVLV